MQIDMHFYGVYALARAAGLKPEDAHTVAYASQFVDDATRTDTEDHEDGGKMRAIATAHSGGQVAKNRVVDKLEQRRVWVPFHFLPGGEGDSLSKQLVCRKDSKIAREMMSDHIAHAVTCVYPLQLMGIACHVYADTYSHWGFSGVGSRNNAVIGGSIKPIDVKNTEMEAYLLDKFGRFMRKYTPNFMVENWRWLASLVGERVSGALGHGAVGTYPDRPFLHWEFVYQYDEEGERRDRDEPNGLCKRDNPGDFMEGAHKIHDWLSEFARQYYKGQVPGQVEFSAIRDTVKKIIELEAPKKGRIKAWQESVQSGALFETAEKELHHYDADTWEDEKEEFPSLEASSKIIGTKVYGYHQAALYHRDYVLKILLPRHEIAVY